MAWAPASGGCGLLITEAIPEQRGHWSAALIGQVRDNSLSSRALFVYMYSLFLTRIIA